MREAVSDLSPHVLQEPDQGGGWRDPSVQETEVSLANMVLASGPFVPVCLFWPPGVFSPKSLKE